MSPFVALAVVVLAALAGVAIASAVPAIYRDRDERTDEPDSDEP